nr:MAG TPA: hypothetical protein [Caudoviricetes sp.]
MAGGIFMYIFICEGVNNMSCKGKGGKKGRGK